MADSDLLFSRTPLTNPADLVFGDTGGPGSDAVVDLAVTLPALVLSANTRVGNLVSGAAAMPALTLASEVNYASNTQRPLTAQATVRWQDADPLLAHTQQRWQDGQRLDKHVEGRWQDGQGVQESWSVRWQEADRSKRLTAAVRFQDGIKVRSGARVSFQEAIKTPRTLRSRFQDGVFTAQGWSTRFQDGTKRPNVQRVRYQDADPLNVGFETHNTNGRLVETGWWSRYQEGIQPKPGRTVLHPVEPPIDPCYIPDPNLVFDTIWIGSPDLLFVCEKHTPPEPGATIVVPVKKVYIVLNTATLYRVDGAVPLPTYSMSMSLDVDSWTWSFSAALPGAALPYISPDVDGNPALVEATLNGVAYRFLITKRGRDRSFAVDGIRIEGKGIAAELADPIAPLMSFGNTIDRTAQALMGEVLTLNGVSLPWAVDWQLENWMVKANNWKKQGRYIEALNEIVAAAGGYLQPHPTDKVLHALLRYPVKPWDWATDVTPDYEIPTAAFTNEGTEWIERAVYDRAYVSGQSSSGGRLVNVRRTGTAGELVAPLVTDPLITDVIAGRQRGVQILGDSGKITNYTLRGAIGIKDTDGDPVGVIPPGKFIQYTDPDAGVTRLGITRSVAVEVRMPEIWQTLVVETHEYV